jgi:hypothetical protein
VSHHFEEFDDERRWLRPPPRRRRRLLLVLPLVAAITLVSLAVGGRSNIPAPPPRFPPVPPPTSRRSRPDARRWWPGGRFAVTNQLGTLRGWFWPNGPQYRQLVGEAKLRRGTKALGPPAYRFTLTRVRVLAPSPRHRILRGRVQVTRPGEASQSYGWDVWMRQSVKVGCILPGFCWRRWGCVGANCWACAGSTWT